MKRISTPLPNENFNSLKPIFGNLGTPPFYDPNDVHQHIWKKGKLGTEEDPKIPTYSKSKINIKDCEYCKICHKINKKFKCNLAKLDSKQDYAEYNTYNYLPKNSNYDSDIKIEVLDIKQNIKNIKYNENLYHQKDDKIDEYLIVE